MVYSRCVEMGLGPEAAVVQTAKFFRIGTQKIYDVSTAVDYRTPVLFCGVPVYFIWYIPCTQMEHILHAPLLFRCSIHE